MSFHDCEQMIRRYAPLYMKCGAPERPEIPDTRVKAKWRPPVPPSTHQRMKRLRLSGVTIGEIARKCRVSWLTAWKHSRVRK